MNNNKGIPPKKNANQPPIRPAQARPTPTKSASQTPKNVQRPQNPPVRRPAPPSNPVTATARPPIQPSYARKRKRLSDHSLFVLLISLLLVLAVLIATFVIIKTSDSPENPPKESTPPAAEVGASVPEESTPAPSESLGATVTPTPAPLPEWVFAPADPKSLVPVTDSNTVELAANAVYSDNIIMVDLKTGKVVCQHNPDTTVYPASITKVMTAIVACDLIKNMNDVFVLTNAITNSIESGAALAGFKVGSPISMKDLLYGALLPSGADATAAIAVALGGSEAEFVKLMNEKAGEIGCTGTNFVNASGLHDKNHYSTVRDLATIMSYAMNNPYLREIMSTASYVPTSALKEGYTALVSTWKGSLGSTYKASAATLTAAKTGWTPEAGNCLASLSITEDGDEYIIVSTGAYSANATISGKNQAFSDVKKLCDTYIN